MKASDIFKVRKGSLVGDLVGANGETLEVSEVTDLTLRADSAKFRVGFKTTNNKLWSITERSAVKFINGVKLQSDGNFRLDVGPGLLGDVIFTTLDALIHWNKNVSL